MDEEEQVLLESEEASVGTEDTAEQDMVDKAVGQIASYVTKRYLTSRSSRYSDEIRWMQAYRNFRGLYGPDVVFTSTEKSRIFVKVTKTKVLAAYGQVTDVLFGNNRFPLSIDPTELPEGIPDAIHFDGQAPQTPEGGTEETPVLKPGETMNEFISRLTPKMQKRIAPVADRIKEGQGTTPSSVTIYPALVAAKRMEKTIHDQLTESNASKHLRNTSYEMALFGTGIMKGPFAVDKEYPKWEGNGQDKKYSPLIKTVPETASCSIWNFYNDPDANSMEESEYAIERHKMSKSQLRKLKRRPYFRSNVIDTVISMGPDYVKEWWESAMDDEENNQGAGSIDRFEVLEYWGYLDTELLEENDVEIPTEFRKLDEVSVNIWVCQGRVIRLVMNPFQPNYMPYYVVPYEVNPYSFFGIGVAENMDDTQTLMNGFMRMAVDNAALSGNLLIEVDETNLVPGQDLSIYPGKIFRRQAGAPGQAIFGTKFPNVSQENMQMFDKARQLSDESTGLPSFAHGQTGVTGVGRTAAGISMLMGAANGSVRTVIKNVDDYLLGPMGRAFYYFNMQFNEDEEIKGDYEVKAQGTDSLMSDEVRSQRLMQFLSIVQNPALAPFAKMDYIIRQIARSLDLDPDKVTNNLADAAIQAEILKGMQAQMPQLPAGQGMADATQAPASPAPGGPPGPEDTSGGGGGNIGVGSAPTPGEPGFSGGMTQ